MSFFLLMLVESSLLGSFWKLFFCILILFVLISTSSFLVIGLGTVFSTPGGTPQNLPKVVKHKTDGWWEGCPQRWQQLLQGPMAALECRGYAGTLWCYSSHIQRLAHPSSLQTSSVLQSADVGKAGKLQHVRKMSFSFLLAICDAEDMKEGLCNSRPGMHLCLTSSTLSSCFHFLNLVVLH